MIFLRQVTKTREMYFYLVQNHPVGINLRISLWVQHYCLVGPEVCQGDLRVLRADVNPINYCILVKIRLADIPNSITCMQQRSESRFMV